jgi:hypothetical protein
MTTWQRRGYRIAERGASAAGPATIKLHQGLSPYSVDNPLQYSGISLQAIDFVETSGIAFHLSEKTSGMLPASSRAAIRHPQAR